MCAVLCREHDFGRRTRTGVWCEANSRTSHAAGISILVKFLESVERRNFETTARDAEERKVSPCVTLATSSI